jgi:hypothetical protein
MSTVFPFAERVLKKTTSPEWMPPSMEVVEVVVVTIMVMVVEWTVVEVGAVEVCLVVMLAVTVVDGGACVGAGVGADVGDGVGTEVVDGVGDGGASLFRLDAAQRPFFAKMLANLFGVLRTTSDSQPEKYVGQQKSSQAPQRYVASQYLPPQ